MRLITGILAGQSFDSTLTGDASLRKRPMRRVIDPLTRMGARIAARDDNFAPLKIQGTPLRAIHYTLPVASAQVKSAVLLAGLFAEGETSVEEPVRTRDHTEVALSEFGACYGGREGRSRLPVARHFSLAKSQFRVIFLLRHFFWLLHWCFPNPISSFTTSA